MKIVQTFFLLSIFLLGVPFAFGTNEMHTINGWKDIAPFAGKVVVYFANSPREGDYHIDREKRLKVGRVEGCVSNWDIGERGYNIDRLLKKGSVLGNCALVDSNLDRWGILMREATAQEMAKIQHAVENEQADLAYWSKKELLKKLVLLTHLPVKDGVRTGRIKKLLQIVKKKVKRSLCCCFYTGDCCICFETGFVESIRCPKGSKHSGKICARCTNKIKDYNGDCPICRSPLLVR